MRYLQERKEVMDTAREISTSNLVVGTWGNVSVKIKDQPLMAITPSGMRYDTMTVEDIVLTDMQLNIVEGKWKPSSESPTHTEIYQHRSDVKAIVHVHSSYATAFAVAHLSIPVIMEETAQVIGHEIKTAAYAICGSRELAVNTVKTLGAGKAVLLANHGLIGVGKNVSDALRVCYIAEETARVACLAKSLGPLHSLSSEEIAILNRNFSSYGQQKN
jgi:L-ribulose-5-phosphate 4-epimerase